MHQTDHGIKENFFRWEGRLNRKRFVKRILTLFTAAIVLYILMFVWLAAKGEMFMQPEEADALAFTGFFALLSLPISVSGYLLSIRRLHDIGLSGFFVLLSFVPLVSLGFALYILFKGGTEGENAYGPDPIAPAAQPDAAYL